MAKAIKNETEIAGIVASHIRDAAALCRYFAWLEANVPSGSVDEISGAAVLEQYRYQLLVLLDFCHSSLTNLLLTTIGRRCNISWDLVSKLLVQLDRTPQ